MFRLDSGRFKNLFDTEHSIVDSGAEQFRSRAETVSKVVFLVWTEAPFGTLFFNAPFHYSVQCEHHLTNGPGGP